MAQKETQGVSVSIGWSVILLITLVGGFTLRVGWALAGKFLGL